MIYGLAGFCPHRFRSHHFPSVLLSLAGDVRVLILSLEEQLALERTSRARRRKASDAEVNEINDRRYFSPAKHCYTGQMKSCEFVHLSFIISYDSKELQFHLYVDLRRPVYFSRVNLSSISVHVDCMHGRWICSFGAK